MTHAQQIAATILEQLGGRKFIAMTGSKNFCATGKGLSMHLTSNKAKAKYLQITLNSMDTYDVKFTKLKAGELVTVKEFEGVYDDMLQEIFTSVTGLYTHL